MATEVLNAVCHHEILEATGALRENNNPELVYRKHFEREEVLFILKSRSEPSKTKQSLKLRFFRWSYHTGCYREFPDVNTVLFYG